MKKFRYLLPQLAIALVLTVATITVLDGFNPLMLFLTSSVSKILIYLTCAVCLITAVADLITLRRK